MVKHTPEKARERFFKKNPVLGCLYGDMNARDLDLVLRFLQVAMNNRQLHQGSMALLSTKRVYDYVDLTNASFTSGRSYYPTAPSTHVNHGAYVLTRLRLGWMRTISRKNRRLRSKRYNYDTHRGKRDHVKDSPRRKALQKGVPKSAGEREIHTGDLLGEPDYK